VIDVDDLNEGKNIKRKLGNFPPYVEKPLLYRLNHQIKPYTFLEDDEEEQYKTHRFTLKCKTNDFKYVSLLKAVCNQDLGIGPSMFNRVYFINIHKETIFHVYDDRGCDVLATAPDIIRDIYKRYNNWILDYDKPVIDKIFS
jgi:hypothetical protein